VLAELITNFHTYMIIGPNHTGSDLFRMLIWAARFFATSTKA
jgi:hypothetical protein